MEIHNSLPEDIDAIFGLYEMATAYQQYLGRTDWKGFERALVEREIAEKRQWKIVEDGTIACVFVTTFSDPYIWQERNEDPSVYLHRIATHEHYRGRGYVKQIAQWAEQYARDNGKSFVRMDTMSGNEKLNAYYESCGFTYLGVTEFTETGDLPEHYKDGSCSLFEIKLG